MRAAMADAEVGDDWYGDDPTVNRLEERCAAITGKDETRIAATRFFQNTAISGRPRSARRNGAGKRRTAPRLAPPRIERIRPRLEIRSSGQSWFDLHVELSTSGGEHFSGAEIQRLLQSGHSYVRTRSGKTAVFDPAMLDDRSQALGCRCCRCP